ncbi:hypothetical protein J4216_05190 [Candidatus Woesearchaeota archaeon]|nr:hypothetical protein [Candidatus Woesearchaeota archaeon]
MPKSEIYNRSIISKKDIKFDKEKLDLKRNEVMTKLSSLSKGLKEFIEHNAPSFWENIRLHIGEYLVAEHEKDKNGKEKDRIYFHYYITFYESKFFGFFKDELFKVKIFLPGWIIVKDKEVLIRFRDGSLTLGKFNEALRSGNDSLLAVIAQLKERIEENFGISEGKIRFIDENPRI